MAHEHIAESSIKYHSSISYSQFIAAKETTPFTIPTSTTGFANSDTWVNGSDLNNWSKSHKGAKLFRSKKTFYETIYGQSNDNVIVGAAPYDVSWMSNTDFREGIEHGARRTWSWDGVLDETIYGGNGNDIVYGLKGDDALYGQNHDDALYGDEGDDSLYGQVGNDYLYGGEGNDLLEGGGNNDALLVTAYDGDENLLKGGAGQDLFVINADTSKPLYTPGITQGAGEFFYDQVLTDATDLSVSLIKTLGKTALKTMPLTSLALEVFKETLPAFKKIFDTYVWEDSNGSTQEIPSRVADGNGVVIADFDPTRDMVFIPIGSDGNINTNPTPNNFTSSKYGLNLDGYEIKNASGDILATIAGDGFSSNTFGSGSTVNNDVAKQTWDNRLTVLNDGTIQIGTGGSYNSTQAPASLTNELDSSEDGGYIFLGAYGSKELYGDNGQGGVDYLFGTQVYGDFLHGFSQDSSGHDSDDTDNLFGYGGNDFLYGSIKNDRLYGGNDSDTAVYQYLDQGIRAFLTDNSAINGNNLKHVTSVTDNGSISYSNDSLSQLHALNAFGQNEALGDALLGAVKKYDGTDSVYSIENIVGTEFADFIKGNSQDNDFMGLGGNDTIYGENGADTIHGGEDDDLIYGGDGDDSLIGGQDYNSDGNDTIHGDKGNDYIHGGDLFDLLHGGSGNDSMYGGSDHDTMYGNDNEDYMHGGYGNDSLFGNNHNDTLNGGQGGADYLNGGWLNDLLIGGNGNDTLDGGKDSDTMTGGTGADTFILSNSTGTDTITDFDSTEGDIIDIETSKYGFSSVSDLSFDATTGELKVAATGTTIVTLENPVDFTSDDIYLDGIQNTDPFLEEQSVVIGEYGTIDGLEIGWQTIDLDNTYVNPVVITSDPTYNGTDVAAIRLRNVDSDSFEARILEPDYYTDNFHGGETISYVVVEAGEWELNDGTRINAGLHNTDNLVQAQSDLDTVDFTDNGLSDFSSTPTVLTQVQTFDGDDWVVTRVDGQSQTGFQVGMQEEESRNSGTHATESIGWLAIEDGASFDSSGDLLLQGGTTGAQVDENFTTINYSQSFDVAPTLIAKMASFDGIDPSVLRIDDNSLSSTTGFEAFVQEDTSLDTETGHALESVSYLGFNGSEGLLTGLAI
ncbi:calcium-binding protein [Dapis sp. BLCC M126]|uniref:calcium-binding protein n=1 Tax=Dapis sp. BLCC M126 TaxID=3400189 RepID=UPI003CF557C2